MVAMVAIDGRTRIASSRRQAEAREWCTAWLRTPWPPLEGESARWLAMATMATMATPKRKNEKKKIHGECPLVNTTHPTWLRDFF